MKWTKIVLQTFLSVAGAILLLAGPAGLGYALPITSITDLHQFRETRSLNDVGFAQGDQIVFGANVVPNGAAGTRFFAILDYLRIPAVGSLPCGGFTVIPNQCAYGTPFSRMLDDRVRLTFINGPDTATEATATLTRSAINAPTPFPVNVTISGSGSAPTLDWTVPAGFLPNAIRVQIFDKDSKTSQGISDIIFSIQLPGTATSYTIPDTLNLSFNKPYVLGIQLIETRDGTSSTGSPNSNISRRSRSFFDFTPIGGNKPPKVHLPTVGPAPDPGSGYGPVYQFSVEGIVPGGMIFIDPYLAVGYDYAIGSGDPNFASVVLPAVQSAPFTLLYPGSGGEVSVSLPADTEYIFPYGGVSSFKVRGIGFQAYLDPGNVTAFITGLTFTGAGNFTGTMTPLIDFSPPAPVFSCVGFWPPANNPVTEPIRVKKNVAIPLKAQLFHVDGSPVVGTDVASDPLLKAFFKSQSGGGTIDVTEDAHPAGLGTEGKQFVFTTDGIWQYNLKTTGYTAPGTYTVFMESGDKSEYLIDPTCEASFVIE